MMFKHNSQQPIDTDASFRLAYKHTTQVDFGGQFDVSACRHIPQSESIPDRVWPGADLKFENTIAVFPNHNSASSALWNMDDSLTVGCNGGSVRQENSKRPNYDGQSYQFGCKRTRQLDSDKSPSGNTCEQLYALVTADEEDEEFKSRKGFAAPEDSTKKSYGTWSASEVDMRLEAPIRLCSFPGYYEDYHRAAESDQLEEIHSPVFDSLPRKRVLLGRDHQADIPVWRSKCFKSSPDGSDSHDASTSVRFLIDDENTDRWTKFCIMLMPDSVSLAEEGLVGHGRDDCYCLDEGSIRCVRQHVAGAREKLRTTLGRECFAELGFCDMGEDVALKWTVEEERFFHETVESNPASLGKNFWDVLPEALPSRSSKELVSYYFNVFMLHKRAEQNRSDPSSADSDDDEWQDSNDGEFGTAEEDEDEDSAIESPVDNAQNVAILGDVDADEDALEEDGDDDEVHDTVDDKSNLSKNFQEVDVHDDSCTSYEDQHNRADSGGPADVLEATCDILLKDDHESLHAEYTNVGMSGMTDHKYIAGLCYPRPWEMIGYTRAVEKDIDLLPTCSVIEEVFGQECWENGEK